jgi:hypothetical protein
MTNLFTLPARPRLATRVWRVWAGERRGCGQFSEEAIELPFSHGLGQGERALVFDFADSPQLAQHLASWSVVENIRSYFSELLPVVPLADCIFYLAQPGDELLLIGVFGHLQHVSQFFDLEPDKDRSSACASGRDLPSPWKASLPARPHVPMLGQELFEFG